jgi:ribonucleoside-diphosphate reductase alpha subunit
MYVVKRDGRHQAVEFDKISKRLLIHSHGLAVDHTLVAQKVVSGLYAGVTTVALDTLAAETAAYMSTQHPDYGTLAARIAVSNLHKETDKSFVHTMRRLHSYVVNKTRKTGKLIADEVMAFIELHAATLDAAIDYQRDFGYDYFGIRTLQRSYLLKIDGAIVERPQHMLMRVAVGIHQPCLENVLRSYNLMSERWFTHASPTMFNAGTPNAQLASCFLLTIGDSIESIYGTLKQCALISKNAGGIGLSASAIRATGSYIAGTNGISNGLVPMLRVYNDTARYVDQGGAKRPGAFAIYLEPWHADIFEFLMLRRNTGKEEQRARDLFYGLWIPDLFMERVAAEGQWSLFCPHECPGLDSSWGDDFAVLYERYEREGRARRTVPALTLWFAICESQVETGNPYMLFKDACNRKSNQQNLGTIRSSNLCTEIVEFTSEDEIAVCNLASLSLPRFVDSVARTFDYDRLREVTEFVTVSLNRVIDVNFYPVIETRNSNMRNRPIGLGVQGLADVFLLMRVAFDSPEAREINRRIFETIYYAALSASCRLAQHDGVYPSYGKPPGAPVSHGILQPDMWGVQLTDELWPWSELRQRIANWGVRNSLLVAPMPTASTSQIMGNNECIEPYTSNIYNRRVLSGEFTVINRHLVRELIALKLWTADMRTRIMRESGSVQSIAEIPADVRALFKTVWEIKQRVLVDMAADRGAFIDQSQSLNIFMAEPTPGKLTSLHFYTWRQGLKTGMYYLRTQPAARAQQFTVEPPTATHPAPKQAAKRQKTEKEGEDEDEPQVCRMEEGCMACSS